MKIICALFLLVLVSYINATSNCNRDITPGSCLDPGAAPGCSSQSCTPFLYNNCKEVITLNNWIAIGVVRTCVYGGSFYCSPTTGTTGFDTATRCQQPPNLITSLVNRGPYECFVCNSPMTGNCAPTQSPGANQGGGWNDPANRCAGKCWTKVTFAARVATTVARGCNYPIPPDDFNIASGSGDVVITCDNKMLCNNAAASSITAPTLTTTTIAPTTTVASSSTSSQSVTTTTTASTATTTSSGSSVSTISAASFTFIIPVFIMNIVLI